MSHHHHDHEGDHHHHHHGDHDHHEHNGQASAMSNTEKLAKLLDHWTAHNEDHAKTYETWAQRAEGEGLPEVAALLRKAGAMNLAINDTFREAAAKLK